MEIQNHPLFIIHIIFHNRLNELPNLLSDQLCEPGAAAAHVDLGTRGADELLHRVLLRSVTYALRIPTEGSSAASGAASDSPTQLRPTLTYDVRQILTDIEDNYLKNKARISFIVCIILLSLLNFNEPHSGFEVWVFTVYELYTIRAILNYIELYLLILNYNYSIYVRFARWSTRKVSRMQSRFFVLMVK